MNKNDEIQKKVFKNTINVLLQQIGIQINEIDDLKRETTFPKLVQLLFNDEIIGWKEIPESWKEKAIYKKRREEQEENNFIYVLNYLALKDKSFKNFGIPNSIKDWIAFIWSFLSKFYVVMPKKNLISVLSQYLQEFEPGLQIKNMVSSFSNGIPYIALLSKASKGSIQFLDKGNPQSNFDYIKESCKKLNIPFVLTNECISSKPDENCNCIQSVIFLKYIGEYDIALSTQNTKTKENDMKKFDEKISDYKESVQNAIEMIDDEQNQFDKVKNCFSLEDIIIKKIFIYQYNTAKRKEIQDCTIKCEDLWNNLLRNSNRTKIEIPSDLININILKQKFNNLEKMVSDGKNNLDNEEADIKAIFLKVPKMQTISLVQEEINKLKEKYDMTKWEQHNHNSFVYILCERLKNYEDNVKNSLENHEKCMKEFDDNFNTIVLKIEDKTGQMLELNNYVFQLECCLSGSKKAISTIMKIDPTNEIIFEPIYFQNKIDLAKKMVEDFKCIRDEIDFKSEADLIIQKLLLLSETINETKNKYENYYSSNITTEVRNTMNIKFPDLSKIESVHNQMIDNHEVNTKFEEMKNVFERTQNELKALYDILYKREKKSIEIEKQSLLPMKEYNDINFDYLDCAVYNFEFAREQLNIAESIKNWDENAYGSTIEKYNKNIQVAHELDQKTIQTIDSKLIKKLNKIKMSINNVVNSSKSPLDSIFEYDSCFYKICKKKEKIKYLLSVNETFKFNKKCMIDEISNEIDQKEEELKNQIVDFQNKISQFINDESSFNISSLKEQLKNDTSCADKLNAYEINEKGISLMYNYQRFLLCIEIIQKFNQRYKMNIEIPENMKELMSVLHDSIIIYRSTLLLNPKSFSDTIIERTQRCIDPQFSFLMAILYVNNKYDIQNITEAKKAIDSFLNPYNTHRMEITEICERIIQYDYLKDHSNFCPVELRLLTDFFTYLPNFEKLFKMYLISISNRNFVDSLIEKIRKMNISQPILIEFLKNPREIMDSKGRRCEVNKSNLIEDNIIIADFGSYETKIGFAYNDMPIRFRTAIGKHRNPEKLSKTANVNEVFYGNNALSSSLKTIYPIEKGEINNWDSIMEFYDFSLKKTNYYDLSEFPVLMSNTIFNRKLQQEKIIQIMFETYNIPSFYMNNSSVLSVYSTGSDTGMSVEIGYETTRFSPVYEGHDISLLSERMFYGGNSINELLTKSLVLNRDYTNSFDEMRIIEDFKKRYCYVALDFEKENANCNEIYHSIGKDGFVHASNGEVLYPEVFFENGISNEIMKIISKIEIDYRSSFYKNIVLSGSTSLLKGFKERLQKEVVEIGHNEANVIRTQRAGYSAWYGGVILANLPVFPNLIVTRSEYDEESVFIVNRKCF